jgi:hypothetical protein
VREALDRATCSVSSGGEHAYDAPQHAPEHHLA